MGDRAADDDRMVSAADKDAFCAASPDLFVERLQIAAVEVLAPRINHAYRMESNRESRSGNLCFASFQRGLTEYGRPIIKSDRADWCATAVTGGLDGGNEGDSSTNIRWPRVRRQESPRAAKL